MLLDISFNTVNKLEEAAECINNYKHNKLRDMLLQMRIIKKTPINVNQKITKTESCEIDSKK